MDASSGIGLRGVPKPSAAQDPEPDQQPQTLDGVAQRVAWEGDHHRWVPGHAANVALSKLNKRRTGASAHSIAVALRLAARESAQGGAPTLDARGQSYLRAVARMVEQGPAKTGLR